MPQVKFLRTVGYKGATYHKGEVVNLSAEDATAVSRFAVDVRSPKEAPKRNVVNRPEVKVIEGAKNTAITNDDKLTPPDVTEPANPPAQDDKKAKSGGKKKSGKSKKDKKVVAK